MHGRTDHTLARGVVGSIAQGGSGTLQARRRPQQRWRVMASALALALTLAGCGDASTSPQLPRMRTPGLTYLPAVTTVAGDRFGVPLFDSLVAYIPPTTASTPTAAASLTTTAPSGAEARLLFAHNEVDIASYRQVVDMRVDGTDTRLVALPQDCWSAFAVDDATARLLCSTADGVVSTPLDGRGPTRYVARYPSGDTVDTGGVAWSPVSQRLVAIVNTPDACAALLYATPDAATGVGGTKQGGASAPLALAATLVFDGVPRGDPSTTGLHALCPLVSPRWSPDGQALFFVLDDPAAAATVTAARGAHASASATAAAATVTASAATRASAGLIEALDIPALLAAAAPTRPMPTSPPVIHVTHQAAVVVASALGAPFAVVQLAGDTDAGVGAASAHDVVVYVAPAGKQLEERNLADGRTRTALESDSARICELAVPATRWPGTRLQVIFSLCLGSEIIYPEDTYSYTFASAV